jgi:hypothetical protein
MAYPKVIPGFHRTHDRPTEWFPAEGKSVPTPRQQERRRSLIEFRLAQRLRLNAAIRSKTKDSTPLGTFLGNEQESEFKPTPPPTGHHEGFEGSAQCGCKICADRRKRTSDSQQPIRNIADLNRANKKAFGSR